MMMLPSRPDPEKILAGLKDFQRDTVEYVFHRMYRDADPTRRFLVADEVGLGKTLVARGLVAKVAHHLWDSVSRIDIVYICSNAAIARQNVNRLNIAEESAFALPSRVTMLPTTVHDLQKNRLNLVSLTPATSFQLRSSLGTAEERALLYWLLDRAWGIGRRAAPLNLLQGTAGKDAFRERVRRVRDETDIDDDLADAFAQALLQRIRTEQEAGREDIRRRFDTLCERFGHARRHGNRPQQDLDDRRGLVGELRALLAGTCLRALQPDLIILDEFQRFKYLLEGDDDAAILARELFDYADEVSKARVLLLSATPYKMYTMSHEQDENHYEDFVRTLRFLAGDENESQILQSLLLAFRRHLFSLAHSRNGDELEELKTEIERRLKRMMVRTERLGATPDRSGMLAQIPAVPKLTPEDIASYLDLQQIARLLDLPETLEYWKSAPYLLSFMDDYEFKEEVTWALESPDLHKSLGALVDLSRRTALPWASVEGYKGLDPGNARMRLLLSDTAGKGAWRLLWIPPALPYCRLAGPFGEPALRGFTKRLVFSCWRVVPKAIAALLSYEAERLMIRSFEPDGTNAPEARRRRSGLLRFTRESDGRLTGMPVLALLYPSFALARLGDPLRLVVEEFNGIPPEPEALVEIVRRKIQELLPQIGTTTSSQAGADERWYWAAPILLDLQSDPYATRRWWEASELAQAWGSQDDSEEDNSAWQLHVENARALVATRTALGAPPDDLALVLAQLAIASPAVCLLRMFSRLFGDAVLTREEMRDAAGSTAWGFRSLFNHPEVTALIRGLNSAEPYWRRVLEYALDGGLQSVLDEYAHVLWEMEGLNAKPVDAAVEELVEAIYTALALRTPTLGLDDITVDAQRQRVRLEPRRMRARFALRFGEGADEETGAVTRADQVRIAFNSPFWPFVLATTSVGQEGLDFHAYCHAVVHWNLPANPVDLEQREGRVHRYKGHAIRKNVAARYGISRAAHLSDPWGTLFDVACRDRPPGTSDLTPFWVFHTDDGARIERYVLSLPLSRDEERLRELQQSLTVYRLVFGQPRQEDLLAFLLQQVGTGELSEQLTKLRIDLSPPKTR